MNQLTRKPQRPQSQAEGGKAGNKRAPPPASTSRAAKKSRLQVFEEGEEEDADSQKTQIEGEDDDEFDDENDFDFNQEGSGEIPRVEDLASTDLQRMSALNSKEAVSLLRNLTKLLFNPKEATKSTRKEIAKALRLLMKKNLYPTAHMLDEVVSMITKTEAAHPILSSWSLEMARKIRGKFGTFLRLYFEGALTVPHLNRLTPPARAREIILQRQQEDGKLDAETRTKLLRKATIDAARRALGAKGSPYLLKMTEKIYKCFLEGRTVNEDEATEEQEGDWDADD